MKEHSNSPLIKLAPAPRPEPPDGILTGQLLHEGIVAIEGQRYKAEYVVSGWRAEPHKQIEVEVIPLAWEDLDSSSVSTQELGSLTGAGLAAHELVTDLVSDL